MGTRLRLPNAPAALVPPRKVNKYRLSLGHPVGGAKARFFRRLGYDDENSGMLEEELVRLARDGELLDRIPSAYGVKYIVEGRIRTPSGRDARVTSIWLIEAGRHRPRLVTAYPTRQRQESDDA